MSECGCKPVPTDEVKNEGGYTISVTWGVDRSACTVHSDAALAAKDEQYQANMEDLRQQRDRAIDDCAKQLQAMFDREQLATKSAESLSCMVEQLKGEAGNRIVEAARLREEIAVQRRDGIAKDERIRELEAEVEVGVQLSGSFFGALKPLKLQFINVANPGQHVTDLIDQLAQLRQQVEAETIQSLRDVAPLDTAWLEMLERAVKRLELRRRIPAKQVAP